MILIKSIHPCPTSTAFWQTTVGLWYGWIITSHNFICSSADSRRASNQWEISLQSNTDSHWLGANLESVLMHTITCRFSQPIAGSQCVCQLLDTCSLHLFAMNVTVKCHSWQLFTWDRLLMWLAISIRHGFDMSFKRVHTHTYNIINLVLPEKNL